MDSNIPVAYCIKKFLAKRVFGRVSVRQISVLQNEQQNDEMRCSENDAAVVLCAREISLRQMQNTKAC